ncbi:hypothetical protein D3C78_1587090 [compost metagenome]
MAAVSPFLNGRSLNTVSTPSMRALGGAPVERNRSEPFLLDKIDNSASISMAKSTREAFNEQTTACAWRRSTATMIDVASTNHAQD